VVDLTGTASKGKYSPDDLAKHFQKIEPRWEKSKRRRPKKHFTLAWRRRREIQIILQNRGEELPAHIIDDLVHEKAQILGDSLGLTAKEREMLKITTIRPYDQTVEEREALRKARKRERDRERQRQRRQPRAEYLAANHLSRTRPWEAEGITRRTWERRRNKRVASPSPTTYSSMVVDAPASVERTVQAFPFTTTVGYLLRLYQYRQLTSGKLIEAVPGLAACSELRRVA